MRQDIPDRLLERYCAGECTPSEKADVEAWVAADPTHAEALALLAAAWRAAGAATVPAERPDIEMAWAAVRRRIEDRDHSRHRLHPAQEEAGRPAPRFSTGISPHRPAWRRLVAPGAVAAALALAVGGGLALRGAIYPAGVSEHVVSAREIVTRRGQQAALDLPDGSRVVMAAGSRLRVLRAYGQDAGPRDVFLEGEAYFDVKHDSRRPFRVHAANGIAEDVGTAFVVTAYPETEDLQVVVTAGAVALGAADSVPGVNARPLVTLTRGDLGRLDSAGTAMLTHDVPLASYTAWMTGSLVFDGARMRDVAARLARWYDIDVHLADADLADRRLTVTFRGESARQALDHVALSLGVDAVWHGRVVELRRPRR